MSFNLSKINILEFSFPLKLPLIIVLDLALAERAWATWLVKDLALALEDLDCNTYLNKVLD